MRACAAAIGKLRGNNLGDYAQEPNMPDKMLDEWFRNDPRAIPNAVGWLAQITLARIKAHVAETYESRVKDDDPKRPPQEVVADVIEEVVASKETYFLESGLDALRLPEEQITRIVREHWDAVSDAIQLMLVREQAGL